MPSLFASACRCTIEFWEVDGESNIQYLRPKLYGIEWEAEEDKKFHLLRSQARENHPKRHVVTSASSS